MPAIFLSALRNSLEMSASLFVALILGRLLRKKVSASARCIMWTALAVLLLAPARPKITLPFLKFDAANLPIIVSAEAGNSDETGSSAPRRSLAEICSFVWFIGVFIIIAVRAFRLRKFMIETRRMSETVTEEIFGAFVRAGGAKTKLPRLRVCKAVFTPVLLGIFNPVILLPDRDYSPCELNMLLSHELTHWRRKDGIIGFIASLAAAVNWFNPLAHIAARRLRVDAELACDEKVTRDFSVDEKKEYGAMLLDAASFGRDKKRRLPLAGLAFTGEAKNLKNRLAYIFENKKHTFAANLCLVFALVLAVSVTVNLGQKAQAASAVEGAAQSDKSVIGAEKIISFKVTRHDGNETYALALDEGVYTGLDGNVVISVAKSGAQNADTKRFYISGAVTFDKFTGIILKEFSEGR